MYNVKFDGRNFDLKMNRWDGGVLSAQFSADNGLVGTLRHHGMVADLARFKIRHRGDKDILAQLKADEIAENPPYQSELGTKKSTIIE